MTPAASPPASSMDGSHLGGHAAQLLAVTFHASMLVAQAALLDVWSPWAITGIQFGLAALLGWILLIGIWGLPSRQLPFSRMLAFGMVAPGGALLLSVLGVARTDIISATVIWGLVPLLVPLAGRIFLKERLQPLAYSGAVIGFVLVIWLVAQRQTTGAGDLVGNLLVVAAVCCTTLSQVMGRSINLGGRYPFQVVAVMQLTGAAIVTLSAASVAFFLGANIEFLPVDSRSIGLLAYLVVFCGTLNFLSYNFALTHLPVSFVSLYVTLVPAIGSVLGMIFLDATLSLLEFCVITCIVASVVIPSLNRMRKRTQILAE